MHAGTTECDPGPYGAGVRSYPVFRMTNPQPTLEDGRSTLGPLLGPAQEFGPDPLCWTGARRIEAPGGLTASAYDPSSHEAAYYHHDRGSGLRELVAVHSTALGASVALADARSDPAERLAGELDAELLDVDGMYAEQCEVLSPNALGGVRRPETIPMLGCRVCCGPANNQLLHDPEDATLLAERGILHGPGYVVTSGGLIQVGVEHVGGGPVRARDRRPRPRHDARAAAHCRLDGRGGAASRRRAAGRGPGGLTGRAR